MTNKAFVRLLVLLPLLMIAAAGVYLFTRSSPAPTVPAEVSSSSKPQTLVPERVISPVLSFDGEKIWFMTEAGKLFRKRTEGGDPVEEYPLSAVIQNPEGVLWPTDSKDFIVVSTLDGHSRYLFFDAMSSALAPYPSTLRSPRFLPGGNKIVYDWVTASVAHELKVSDARGTNFTKIADLFRPDYELLASPVKQEVALWTRDLKNPSKLLVVDLFTGKFRALGTNAGYQGVSFSPDGTKLLAAKSGADAGSPPRLVLFDLLTSQARDLSVRAEIERTAWQEDGQALLIGSPAGFIKYQLADGQQTEIYKFGADEAYSPQNLILHPQKPLLFFVDQKTGYLYRLDLQN